MFYAQKANGCLPQPPAGALYLKPRLLLWLRGGELLRDSWVEHCRVSQTELWLSGTLQPVDWRPNSDGCPQAWSTGRPLITLLLVL